ncbi:hypothetical protein HYC85_027054 [Camellia sinensis]|uniref:Serine-threonine/tyrosine-protein kinase catalytic domain-containing protein n=1 Tax=Camellia sinensis TaxID=4442 RepID=A0A7J7G6J6_CAMSI|nr:hypothetical protein HYC85_027054 [Camellia sinensis]
MSNQQPRTALNSFEYSTLESPDSTEEEHSWCAINWKSGSCQTLEKSPDFQIDGLFSMKSSVFCFKVIVLEILSGKRNRLFHYTDHDFNLLGHPCQAWTLWIEGKAYEPLDPLVESSLPMLEILRCIQKYPEDSPTMSFVLLTLIIEAASNLGSI